MIQVPSSTNDGLSRAKFLSTGSRKTVLRWVNTFHPETAGLPEEMVQTLYPEFYEYLTPFPEVYMRVLATFDDFAQVVENSPGTNPDFEGTYVYQVWKKFDDSFGFTSNEWLSKIRGKAQKMNAMTQYYPGMVSKAARLSHAIDSVPLREKYKSVSMFMTGTATFMSHKATELLFAVIDDALGEEYMTATKMKTIRNRYSDFADFTAKKMEEISE